MPRKLSLDFIKWTVKMGFYMDKMLSVHKQIQTGCYILEQEVTFQHQLFFAGITMKVPFVMHDCDANPGLVTRKTCTFCKKYFYCV